MKNFLLFGFISLHLLSKAQLFKHWPHSGQFHIESVKYKDRVPEFHFPDSIMAKNKIISVKFSMRQGLYNVLTFDTLGRKIKEENGRKYFLKKKEFNVTVYNYSSNRDTLTITVHELTENGDTLSITKETWKAKKLLSQSFLNFENSFYSEFSLSSYNERTKQSVYETKQQNLKKVITNESQEVIEAYYNYGRDTLHISQIGDTIIHTRYFLLKNENANWVKANEKKIIHGITLFRSYYDFNSEESSLTWREHYHYNENQRLIFKDSPNSPFKTSTYIYDKKGLLVKVKYKLMKGFYPMKRNSKTLYKYKYY